MTPTDLKSKITRAAEEASRKYVEDWTAKQTYMFTNNMMLQMRTNFIPGFIAGYLAALESDEVSKAIEALSLRQMHDDDCADSTEKFGVNEMCECGASLARPALKALTSLQTAARGE